MLPLLPTVLPPPPPSPSKNAISLPSTVTQYLCTVQTVGYTRRRTRSIKPSRARHIWETVKGMGGGNLVAQTLASSCVYVQCT